MQERVAQAREGIRGKRCWGDAMDRAVGEAEQESLLKQTERDQQTLQRIDAALERIHNHRYGYCLKTSEPIGLKRLMLNPIATLSYKAQQQAEKQGRDK